jgi:hypothetical protein
LNCTSECEGSNFQVVAIEVYLYVQIYSMFKHQFCLTLFLAKFLG